MIQREDAPIPASPQGEYRRNVVTHSLPVLDRPASVDLSMVPGITTREQEIFRAICQLLPGKEFPIFFEHTIDGIARGTLGVESGILGLNPLHLSLVDFTRRTIGTADRFFDDNRDGFEEALRGGGQPLIDKWFSIEFYKPYECGELRCTVGEMFAIIMKLITSEAVYRTAAARKLLLDLYDHLLRKAIGVELSIESGDTNTLSFGDVVAVKAGTNVPDGRLLFSLACADYCTHPNYRYALAQVDSSKIAGQIKNDSQGIHDDFNAGNANYFIALSREFGELDALMQRLDGGTFRYCLIKESAPLTWAFLVDTQRVLLNNIPLPTEVRDAMWLENLA